MRSDSQDDGTESDSVAQARTAIDETQRAVEASHAILDRRAERSADGPAPERPEARGRGADMLGEISDGLIHAYRFAKQDGDPLTVVLIENALLHVGRRLARGLSPAEAGVVCH